MKIFVRFGHSTKFQGANGYLNEVSVIREYAPWVAQTLYYAGHDVHTFDPDTTGATYSTSSAELTAGINAANAMGADLFVSCHVNAGGGNGGVEVLYYPGNTYTSSIGTKICSDVASSLGIINRGVKSRTDLGELNNTNMPALIVEPFFVDVQSDCNKYTAAGAEKLGKAIAGAILQSI